MNTYPAPLLRQQCEDSQQQQGQVNVPDVFEAAKRPPIHRYLTSLYHQDILILHSHAFFCDDIAHFKTKLHRTPHVV